MPGAGIVGWRSGPDLYRQDWRHEAPGRPPLGWSGPLAIETRAGALSGRVLAAAEEGVFATFFGESANPGTVREALVLLELPPATIGAFAHVMAIRAFSLAGTGYSFRIGTGASGGSVNQVSWWKHSPGWSDLGAASVGGFAYGTRVWLRARIEAGGDNLRGKVWQHGSAEPGSWSLTRTDSDHAPDRIGIYVERTTARVEYFSFAEGGAAAPGP